MNVLTLGVRKGVVAIML